MFMWFDLSATDTDQAREFYTGLFGWTISSDAAGGYKAWILNGDQPWAGIVAGEKGAWLPYVVVDDLEDATKRAVGLGATVITEASDGPAGTSVTIADPGGARLALFKPR